MENTQSPALRENVGGSGNFGLDLFNPKIFETMQRICKMYTSSELVPDMYRTSDKNKESTAVGNCMIAIEISHRIGASPLMVMQNMVPIYGRPSWSSKFLIATVNTCGRFRPLKFRFENLGKVGKVKYTDYVWDGKRKAPVIKEFDGTNVDNWECVAYTTAKNDEENVLESSPVNITMAILEGWYTKNGSKWQTMTRQMLTYRTASFWTSAYAPELSMGMRTVEEQEDIIDITHEDVTNESKAKENIKEKGNSKPLDPNNVPPAQGNDKPADPAKDLTPTQSDQSSTDGAAGNVGAASSQPQPSAPGF